MIEDAFSDVFGPDEHRLLSAELAKRLGVHTATVRQWASDGKIRLVNMGCRAYVSRSAFADFLAACNTPAEAMAGSAK